LPNSWRRLSADRYHFSANDAVRVEQVDGRDTLTVTGLDKLEEPPSLLALRDQVQALLPRVDLPEVLLEIHARTGLRTNFTHISEGAARVADLPVSLCAVLLAEACNIGLEPVVRSDVPALTRVAELGPTKLYPGGDADTRECLSRRYAGDHSTGAGMGRR